MECKNIDVNTQNKEDICAKVAGQTPLVAAVYNNNLDIINNLLKHNDICVNKSGFEDNTALVSALNFKYVDIVKLLLNHKEIDINNPVPLGSTAHKHLEEKSPFLPCKKLLWYLLVYHSHNHPCKFWVKLFPE